MPAASFIVLAQQLAGVEQSGQEFSESMARHHALAAAHSWQDAGLVTLGAIVVVVTTIYTVLYFVRPGETGENHIKRRIIDDGYEGSR